MQPVTDAVALDRVTELWAVTCREVAPEQLASSTPCTNWSVLDLIDHVAGGNYFTQQILTGLSADDALSATRSWLDDTPDPIVRSAQSALDQLKAFAQPEVEHQIYHHVVGDLVGRDILRLRVHDMNIHTWDLLQAVNPKKGLDPVLVRWAVADLSDPESHAARHLATGWTLPRTPAELLMAFGRRRGRRF